MMASRVTDANTPGGLAELLCRLVSHSASVSPDRDLSSYCALLNSLGVAIYTTDAVGRLTFYNQAAREIWGWNPPLFDQVWCGSWRIFAPDGSFLPHDQCPMAVCLQERRPVRGAWAFAEQPNGRRIPFAPFPTPLLDDNGNLLGAVNVLVDISGVRAAEEKLTQSEARFRAAQEMSPEGFVVLEAARTSTGSIVDFLITYANPAAYLLLRRVNGHRSLTGASIDELLPRYAGGPDDLIAQYIHVVATGEPREQERCTAADTNAVAAGKLGK